MLRRKSGVLTNDCYLIRCSNFSYLFLILCLNFLLFVLFSRCQCIPLSVKWARQEKLVMGACARCEWWEAKSAAGVNSFSAFQQLGHWSGTWRLPTSYIQINGGLFEISRLNMNCVIRIVRVVSSVQVRGWCLQSLDFHEWLVISSAHLSVTDSPREANKWAPKWNWEKNDVEPYWRRFTAS